jgi:hypothetical protein
VGAPALAGRGHGIGLAGHHTGRYARAHSHGESYSHAAAHRPFAHAVGQPVPVPRDVRAQPIAVGGGVADRERAVRDAVGNTHPALSA